MLMNYIYKTYQSKTYNHCQASKQRQDLAFIKYLQKSLFSTSCTRKTRPKYFLNVRINYSSFAHKTLIFMNVLYVSLRSAPTIL